ncbi:sensor histidine kinase [Alteromonas sediminis]|uniref:sensor histidine kinase n=1 Tax=Alteromonas sediminis TaxID=2259342 RepID=UPI00196B1646|nr:sensor histidine kinase [Alteromonas sediminis]
MVKVTLNEFEDYYSVTVEDNGVGISSEEQHKVFNPFYTLARHKGHVGLGLNIVFNLVSQVLGGTISYQPSSLGGANFRFTLSKTREEVDV